MLPATQTPRTCVLRAFSHSEKGPDICYQQFSILDFDFCKWSSVLTRQRSTVGATLGGGNLGGAPMRESEDQVFPDRQPGDSINIAVPAPWLPAACGRWNRQSQEGTVCYVQLGSVAVPGPSSCQGVLRSETIDPTRELCCRGVDGGECPKVVIQARPSETCAYYGIYCILSCESQAMGTRF